MQTYIQTDRYTYTRMTTFLAAIVRTQHVQLLFDGNCKEAEAEEDEVRYPTYVQTPYRQMVISRQAVSRQTRNCPQIIFSIIMTGNGYYHNRRDFKIVV